MRLSKDKINEIIEITGTNYNFNENGETDEWDILVEDLLLYYKDLEEEYNDYKEREITRYDVEH